MPYLERAGTPGDSQLASTLIGGDLMDRPEIPLIWTRSDDAIPTTNRQENTALIAAMLAVLAPYSVVRSRT